MGFDKDVPDGLVVLVAGIELAADLRPVEMDPVRSAAASALEAWGFAECSLENGAQAVALLPVLGK